MESEEEFNNYFRNIYVFEAQGEDLDQALGEFSDTSAGSSMIFREVDDADAVRHRIFGITGESSQGVHIIELGDGLVRICLPMMSSEADVHMAFSVMRLLSRADSDMIVMDSSGAVTGIDAAAETAVVQERLSRMGDFISGENVVALGGMTRMFYLSPERVKALMPGADLEERAELCMMDFVDLQWNYNDIPKADTLTHHGGDGDMESVVLIGAHCLAHYAPSTMVYHDHKVKYFDTAKFVDLISDNGSFTMLDSYQYVMETMSPEAWGSFFRSLPGKANKRHRVFLLRWNPSFSSFTEEDFAKLRVTREGFLFNWSVYDWRDARDGDLVFMLRESDEDAGLVWAGIMMSDPYEGEDWAGTDRKRYYCDMVAQNYAADGHAIIPIETLEKLISEIDWRRGHAGELLSFETEQKLVELWRNRNNLVAANLGKVMEISMSLDLLVPYLGPQGEEWLMTEVVRRSRPEYAYDDVELRDTSGNSCRKDVRGFKVFGYDMEILCYGVKIGDNEVQMISCIPMVNSRNLYQCRVLSVAESDSGLMAYVTVECEGMELTFLDPLYLRDREHLVAGSGLTFALGALAMDVSAGSGALSLECMGQSEYKFNAVVSDTSHKVDICGLEAYGTRLRIGTGDNSVTVTAVYPRAGVENKPRKHSLMRGKLHLQGSIVFLDDEEDGR